jgi:hypothetical protein
MGDVAQLVNVPVQDFGLSILQFGNRTVMARPFCPKCSFTAWMTNQARHERHLVKTFSFVELPPLQHQK